MIDLDDVDAVLEKAAQNVAIKRDFHEMWLSDVFLKQSRYDRLREIAWFDFVYGSDISQEEKKLLADAAKKFNEQGFWW